MPESITIISLKNYESLLRKAIAFDVVNTVIQSSAFNEWEKILPTLCSGITENN